MAHLAGKYLQRTKNEPIGVVGFDVAGDEAGFPFNSKDSSMMLGVSKAKELGVPLTIHAGEALEKFNSLSNLKFAIDHLKPKRIGHGIHFKPKSCKNRFH